MATSLLGHVLSFLNDFGTEHQEHCLGLAMHRDSVARPAERDAMPQCGSTPAAVPAAMTLQTYDVGADAGPVGEGRGCGTRPLGADDVSRLLAAQRFDRAQAAGANGGVGAEQQADHRAEYDAAGRDRPTDRRREVRCTFEHPCCDDRKD